MKTNHTVEVVGFIKKREHVASIKDKIIPDTFVMESLEPFPDYHGNNLPSDNAPSYIFLMLKKPHRNPQIVRITQKIKKYFSNPFDAQYGVLNFHNEEFPCIRLKNLNNYEYLAALQSCYADEGVEFSKFRKLETNAVLELEKYFRLYKYENTDDFYKDTDEKAISYFTIPKYLNWQLFLEITKVVKNNVENREFDAAQACFYRSCGIIDLIRIYADRSEIEWITNIRNKYLEVMKKYE